jgi:hypothetical protein
VIWLPVVCGGGLVLVPAQLIRPIHHHMLKKLSIFRCGLYSDYMSQDGLSSQWNLEFEHVLNGTMVAYMGILFRFHVTSVRPRCCNLDHDLKSVIYLRTTVLE